MTTVMPEQDVAPVDLLEEVAPYEDADDGNEHLTHIINPPMNRHHAWWSPQHDAQDIVNIARLFGEEIIALCGYKFVPRRNPENYPACQACFKIAEYIMANQGK